MKTLLIVALFILSGTLALHAQPRSDKPNKLYKTWISIEGEKHKKTGALYEVRDSAVILSNSYLATDYLSGKNFELSGVKVKNIHVLSLRRNKAVGRGALIGGLSGATLGMVLGLTSENTASNEKANSGITFTASVLSAVFLGTCTALIGAAIATHKSKYHISGNQKQYDKLKSRLKKYSITYDPAGEAKKLTTFTMLRDTVVDYDGNVYHTAALGGMVFMAENLKATHFRNGREIPCVKDTSGWRKVEGAAYCNFQNNTANVASYGRLYNGNVITDTSGICPAGWHVPNAKEWTSLLACLGGREVAGIHLNAFAPPSGSRDPVGNFSASGKICQWWMAKENAGEGFKGLMLNHETAAVTITNPNMRAGLSVWCLRNK
jgi:uncharacterized protein (TIGR02145 family)